MKICLINVNNCINYSQYGPFLFEHIKNKELSVFSVKNTSELDLIYEDIVSELNRNAFLTEEITIFVTIARDITSFEINEYDVYNKINIYQHIISKLSVNRKFKVFILYMDTINSVSKGKVHAIDEELSETYITNDAKFAEILPIGENFTTFSELQAAIDKISNVTFRNFFSDVLCHIDQQSDKMLSKKNLSHFFASECAGYFGAIKRKCELIPPASVDESILTTLKVVYFVKDLSVGDISLDQYDEFEVDYNSVKRQIATYRERLSHWLNEKKEARDRIQYSIDQYLGATEIGEFQKALEQITKEKMNQIHVNNIGGFDLVDAFFSAIEEVVHNAEEEMEKYATKTVKHYFADENYQPSDEDVSVYDDPVDKKRHENDLLDELNQYTCVTLPTYNQQLRIEQKLENANDKINYLLRCHNAYRFKAFLMTLAFAVAGVAVLYLIAQFSVFVKENSFPVYLSYCCLLALAFSSVYFVKAGSYQKKINKLFKQSKQEAEAFLDAYLTLANNFEHNIRKMAEYYCFKKFLIEGEISTEEARVLLQKYNWHVRKIKEILTNFNHFNDFVGLTDPVMEENPVRLDSFDHNAEHTEFYQVKIF